VFNVRDSEWLSDQRTFYIQPIRLDNDSLPVYFDYTEPYQLTAVIHDGGQSQLELTTLTAATRSPSTTDPCYYLVGMYNLHHKCDES